MWLQALTVGLLLTGCGQVLTNSQYAPPTPTPNPTPTPPPAPTPPTVTQIVSSNFGSQNCVLFSQGAAKCWGNNDNGQLGYGDTQNRGDMAGQMGAALPALAFGASRTVQQIAINGNTTGHACAVLDTNDVTCWGDNSVGELGLGDTNQRLSPNAAPLLLGTGRTARSIIVGDHHTCAILDTHNLLCWGGNESGQLGVGDTQERHSPLAGSFVNLGIGRTASYAVAGNGYTCSILDTGDFKCWGKNGFGELGVGDTVGRSAPLSTPINIGTGRTAVDASIGNDFVCVIRDIGDVLCWGFNGAGQLGLGDTNQRTTPPATHVNLGTGRTALTLFSGSNHTCALLDTGYVACWGANDQGQLGVGDTTNRTTPILVNLANEVPKAVTVGIFHSCALMADSNVLCWGANDKGQLGLGDTITRGISTASTLQTYPPAAVQ